MMNTDINMLVYNTDSLFSKYFFLLFVAWFSHEVPPWLLTAISTEVSMQRNPRTAIREIPTGIISPNNALIL